MSAAAFGDDWRRFLLNLPLVDEDFTRELEAARRGIGPPPPSGRLRDSNAREFERVPGLDVLAV
jgi:hypothetical protein